MIAMPPALPMVCQRSSPPTTRSGYDAACGSSKTRAAVSKETPCFRWLMRFFLSSHTKIMCIYESVALRFAGLHTATPGPPPVRPGVIRAEWLFAPGIDKRYCTRVIAVHAPVAGTSKTVRVQVSCYGGLQIRI